MVTTVCTAGACVVGVTVTTRRTGAAAVTGVVAFAAATVAWAVGLTVTTGGGVAWVVGLVATSAVVGVTTGFSNRNSAVCGPEVTDAAPVLRNTVAPSDTVSTPQAPTTNSHMSQSVMEPPRGTRKRKAGVVSEDGGKKRCHNSGPRTVLQCLGHARPGRAYCEVTKSHIRIS